MGIPERVDRNRWLDDPGELPPGTNGALRPLGAPGSRFEYKDVRINQLSLVTEFAERIHAPLHCSDALQWQWHKQGWTDSDGQRLTSVPGGSLWAGGVRISAFDQARIGLRLVAGGKVDGHPVLSANGIRRMQLPCEVAPWYGDPWSGWTRADTCLPPRREVPGSPSVPPPR